MAPLEQSASVDREGMSVGFPKQGKWNIDTLTPETIETGTANITFEDLISLLQKHNPKLQAASEKISAAEGRTEQAALLPNPSAEVGVEALGLRGNGADGAAPTLRFTQPIRRSAERRAAVAVGQSEIETARYQLEKVRLELIGELRETYADVLFHRQALALNDELTSLSHRSLEIAQTRFELQASPQSDVSRAEVELFDLAMARREIEREGAQTTAQLTELLGGSLINTGLISGEFAPSITELSTDSLRNWVIKRHPALEVAGAEERSALERIRLAQQEALPDLEVSAGLSHQLGEGANNSEFALGFELPIFDRNQGRIAESQAELRGARLSTQSIANQLLSRLTAALADWSAANDRLAYHTSHVLPSAQQALEQVREGYLAGKLDFLELMDAQRTLVTAKLQQLELNRELIQAEVRLYSLAGPALTTSHNQNRSKAPTGELP